MATAVLFSTIDEVRTRFPEYIAEIGTFLAQHQVPVDTPDVLQHMVARRTTDTAFRDDLASMLTVVCFEKPETTALELLGMLLAAAGVPTVDETPSQEESAAAAARELFQIAREIRRRAGTAQEVGGSESPEVEPIAVEQAAFDTPPVPAGAVRNTFPSVPTASMDARHERPALARALALAADEEAEQPMVSSWHGATPSPEFRTERKLLSGTHLAIPDSVPSRTRWVTWAVGAVCLLLGVVLGRFLLQPVTPRMGRTSEVAVDDAARAALPRISSPSRPTTRANSPKDKAALHQPLTDRSDLASSRAVTTVNRDGSKPAGSRPAPPVGSTSVDSRGGESRRVLTAPAPWTTAGARVPPVREVHLSDVPPARGGAAGLSRTGRVDLGTAGIMAANLVSSPAPAYPPQASAAQVQGEVIIEAIVGKNGEVVNSRVVSGPPLLRDAALNAVQQWRYRPYEVDGKPIEIATTARFDFKLNAR